MNRYFIIRNQNLIAIINIASYELYRGYLICNVVIAGELGYCSEPTSWNNFKELWD